MKEILKKSLPDIIAIAIMLLISIAFMFPAMSSATLTGHDTTAGIGAGQELYDYYQQTGHRSRWTNALFSGMPTYQSAPTYPATTVLNAVENVYHLFLPSYVWYLFAMLLGFYILMRVLKFNVYISMLGAIIWAFSSYFIIIIQAGHIWKLVTLSYIPATIAGMILIYRKNYGAGFALTALFAALQLKSNHIQMSYYFMFVMFAIAVVYGIQSYKQKEFKTFWRSTAILAAAGIIAIGVNASSIYHTWQYTKESTRGGSEITFNKEEGEKASKGLDRAYITHWSYGIDETLTLLVPNLKGGASLRGSSMLPVSKDKIAMKHADRNYKFIYQQLPQYFGEQPMTCGPVYIGAFVCLLFILGLLIVKGPIKWSLLAVTILSILLSWGKNFQWFTDLFIDYFPLYSKFRTVSSILVIAEFTMPLLGILGLAEYLRKAGEGTLGNKEYAGGKLTARGALWISFAASAGLALILAVAPGIAGPAFSTEEFSMFQNLESQYANAGYEFPLRDFLANLTEMRQAVISADAWRSFLFIAAGMLIMLLVSHKKVKTNTAVALITLVCFVDLWSVDRRYLSSDLFTDKSQKTAEYKMTKADETILQDTDPDYRVANLTTDTFNENFTSYRHKSVGGYHAAKLSRYQNMISYYLDPECKRISNTGDISQAKILSMLNTKYYILPSGDGPVACQNPYAFGNAWFIDEISYVDNANDEFQSLVSIHPYFKAVADQEFSSILGTTGESDKSDHITLTKYCPDELTYTAESKNGGIGVFSEIYYPGWKATIDGVKVEIGRVDYVLRALKIPAGIHEIKMTFRPTSLKITNIISYISLALMVLSLALGIYSTARKKN